MPLVDKHELMRCLSYDMLPYIEERYGVMNTGWTVIDIEFTGYGDEPRLRYNGNNIIIHLAQNIRDNVCFACFQLAHEAVHLLSPTGTPHTRYLEEGLAAVYSVRFMDEHFPGHNIVISNDPADPYLRAVYLVDPFLNAYPDAIKKLRAIEPCFNAMTPQTFHDAQVACSQELIDKLLAPFKSASAPPWG